MPHQRRQPGVGLAGARPDVGCIRRHRRRPRDQGAHPHRHRRELQRQLGADAQRGPRRKTRLPADARHSRPKQARRKGLVCTALDHQRARRRRADDQRRQWTVQHAFRGAAARRYRAGLRGRLLPGRIALPPRPGARRRPACDLELSGRPHPCSLFPIDRHEARGRRSQGVGRGQRGAAQRQSPGPSLGAGPRARQTSTADAALLAPAVHQPAQAGVHRRAGSRPGPRNLRTACVFPVRRRDGATRSGLGPRTLEQWRSTQRRSALVTSIQQRLSTGRGKFTTDYPELGTAPVSYEDSISEEFFTAEREAVFKRNWLCVGRIERLPRKGSYFTRDLPGCLASIVVARDLDDTVHAFHNVCAHRGNKVVWQEHPGEESSGSCRAFSCKYHGWRYGLDGKVNHITNEEEFFDLDKSMLRMPAVHCEVWAGFIFVNLASKPGQVPVPLRSFLGDGLLPIEGYPLHLMTQHYGFSTRINGNWKLAVDSVCEWYHPPYVHGRFIDPDVAKAEMMVPPVDSYPYELFRPTMLTSVPGPPPLPSREPGTAGPARQDQRWVYKLFRAGLFGADDVPDIGLDKDGADFLNRGNIASWGNDQFWLFPNISVQIWARGYYITYSYWPETVDSHIYEIDLYFVPPANAQERLAQELVVDSTIEFAMQDVNTIEATHSALKTRAQSTFHLSDLELLIRQFHAVIRETVAGYQSGNTAREAWCRVTLCRQH